MSSTKLASRFLDSPWVSAAVMVACVLGVATGGRSPPDPSPHATRRPPTAEDLALLGGLAEGEKIAGWTVLGVSRPSDDVLRIDFGRDAVRFAIDVSPLGARSSNPPIHTDRYAIYYGHAHPRATRIPDNAIRAISADLARRIHANE